MHPLVLKEVPEQPDESHLYLYPDFLIGCLLRQGIGRLEADLSLEQNEMVDFVLTPEGPVAPRVIAQIGSGYFRSVLARFGARLSEEMLYGGHQLFSCGFEREGRVRTHRFSAFTCNHRGTAFWLRLYLYCIDGLWPNKEVVVA